MGLFGLWIGCLGLEFWICLYRCDATKSTSWYVNLYMQVSVRVCQCPSIVAWCSSRGSVLNCIVLLCCREIGADILTHIPCAAKLDWLDCCV